MVQIADAEKSDSFLGWIREAWSAKQRHPPVGSNRDLALVLLRFLVLLTMFSSAFMAITGSLLSDVSDISSGFAIFWLFFPDVTLPTLESTTAVYYSSRSLDWLSPVSVALG